MAGDGDGESHEDLAPKVARQFAELWKRYWVIRQEWREGRLNPARAHDRAIATLEFPLREQVNDDGDDY